MQTRVIPKLSVAADMDEEKKKKKKKTDTSIHTTVGGGRQSKYVGTWMIESGTTQ